MSDKADPIIKEAFKKYLKSGIKTDLMEAVSCLNYHYSTRLSKDEMNSLCDSLSIDDFKMVKSGKKSGKIDRFVKKILEKCQDKRTRYNFSFATKLAYFATEEQSPIFDKYVDIAIRNRGYTGGRNFNNFYSFMASLSKELKKNFRILDDFLMEEGKKEEGKNMEEGKKLKKKKILSPRKKSKNTVTRNEVVKWWKDNLKKEKSYEFNVLIHPNDYSKSYQPSDHCYNKTNISDIKRGFPEHGHELLFWWESDGVYIFKGSNANVTGKVIWTDKNKKETIIGEWKNGEFENYNLDIFA